jgi:hypothetical protein
MSLINISICLTDLPKDKIKQAGKEGKKYINLCVASRREVDQYGKTHFVFVSQTEEERKAKVDIIFVGSGTEIIPKSVTYESVNSMPVVNNTDDLPF